MAAVGYETYGDAREERECGGDVAGGERRGEVAVVEAHAQRPQRAAVQREEQEREEGPAVAAQGRDGQEMYMYASRKKHPWRMKR